ncbi:hypothetical protein ACPF0S_09335 [Leuconostoc suionicum]|uniref:hypothetical protein n=1 Tax=Leuconostoc suionicum TaxID=1511761 RepID=UPI003C4B27AD
MGAFLLPITFFTKTFGGKIESAETLSMLAFPAFVLLLLLQLFRYPKRVHDIIPSTKSILLGCFFLVAQSISIFLSYNVTGDNQQTTGIVRSYIFLFGWILTVYLAWAIVAVSVTNHREEKLFINSGLVSLTIYVVLVLFPQLLVSIGQNWLLNYVNTMAALFERHWVGRNDFYIMGSYVATNHRLNGFEPEAAVLANLLSIIYLPILLGFAIVGQRLVRVKNKIFNSKYIVWVMIFILFTFLIMAKTSTGIIELIVALLIWFGWSKKNDKIFLAIISFLGLLFITLMYVAVPTIHNILNQFLFQKSGTDNRIGGTIALMLTFLSHPFLGVGYDYTGYFILKYVPEWTTHNWEYVNFYSKERYPILSAGVGWFATFGLVIMLPALWMLGRMIVRSIIIQNKLKDSNTEHASWNRAIQISFLAMTLLVAVSAIFAINIFLWPYLIMFFFYRQHLINQEKELAL